MAGIVNFYTSVPRVRNIITNKVILSVAGANPVDAGPVELPNVRGQLTFDVTSGNGFNWGLEIIGGFGEFPDDWTRNFTFSVGTERNCTVDTPQLNTIEVTTPAADAGGRRYVFNFFPPTSVPGTIQQTSVNVLGVEDLTVTITKPTLLPGF
jgi:hypothetical protein